MKKRISLIAVIALLVVCCLPTAAFAANEESMSTSVTYNIQSGYIVSIPASISLNNSNYISFSAENVAIEAGRKLYIALDHYKTELSGGCFILHSTTGNGHYVPCDLEVSEDYEGASKTSLYSSDYIVASFDSGYFMPSSYGRLYITPHSGGIPAGDYSGVMYFNIYVF